MLRRQFLCIVRDFRPRVTFKEAVDSAPHFVVLLVIETRRICTRFQQLFQICCLEQLLPLLGCLTLHPIPHCGNEKNLTVMTSQKFAKNAWQSEKGGILHMLVGNGMKV